MRRGRRAEERATRLQSVPSALSQALTPADVARAILTEALGGMGARSGAVYRRRADSMLEMLYAVGHPESFTGHSLALPLEAHTPGTDAARTGRELWFRSTRELAELYPEVVAVRPAVGDHAVAALPMWVHGQPVGAIVLSFAEPRTAGPEELQFLRMLAQAAARRRLPAAPGSLSSEGPGLTGRRLRARGPPAGSTTCRFPRRSPGRSDSS